MAITFAKIAQTQANMREVVIVIAKPLSVSFSGTIAGRVSQERSAVFETKTRQQHMHTQQAKVRKPDLSKSTARGAPAEARIPDRFGGAKVTEQGPWWQEPKGTAPRSASMARHQTAPAPSHGPAQSKGHQRQERKDQPDPRHPRRDTKRRFGRVAFEQNQAGIDRGEDQQQDGRGHPRQV